MFKSPACCSFVGSCHLMSPTPSPSVSGGDTEGENREGREERGRGGETREGQGFIIMIQAWRGPGDALGYHPIAPRRYGKCDYRKERNMARRLKSARLGRQGIVYLPAPSYSLFVHHSSILTCPNPCCTPQLSSTLICEQSSYAHRYCLILRDGHWRNQRMGKTETGKEDTKTEKKFNEVQDIPWN